MHSGHQGETEICVRRTDWTSDHCHRIKTTVCRSDRIRAAGRWIRRDKENPQYVRSSAIQHAEPLKVVRSKDESASSMSAIQKLIEEKVIPNALEAQGVSSRRRREPIPLLMALSKNNAVVPASRSKIVSASNTAEEGRCMTCSSGFINGLTRAPRAARTSAEAVEPRIGARLRSSPCGSFKHVSRDSKM